MNVLLISANSVKAPYPVYPLGIDYVAGAISSSHRVEIIDINMVEPGVDLKKVIQGFEPDIVGISLRNVDNTDTHAPEGYIPYYQDLVKRIRDIRPVRIVLGGSAFTLFPEEMMERLGADYGIIGEGERFILLLDALETKSDVSKIPGVILPKMEKDIPPPLIHAPMRYFDDRSAHIRFYLDHGGMLNLQTKRGCPYRCIYCTYPYIEGKKLRFVDPDHVAQTAVNLQKAGAKYFYITDSVFNADIEHSLAVARAFIRYGVSIPWGAFFAPMKVPDSYYPQLAEAGLSHVEFGTEALSDVMLENYRKPFRVDDVLHCHRKTTEIGLHTAHFLLFGGPGEDRYTVENTLANAERLSKTVIFFFGGIRIYPHTHIYELAVREHQISRTQNILEPVFYHSRFIDSHDIMDRIEGKADNRLNWIIGAGGEKTVRVLSRMHAKGYCGPLWEKLVV